MYRSFSTNRSRFILFLISIIILASADLIIKSWVESHWVREWKPNTIIESDETLVSFYGDTNNTRLLIKEVVVIENFWSFTYVRNYNIGFSLLAFMEEYLSPQSMFIFLKIFQLFGLFVVIGYFFYKGMNFFLPFLLIISGGLGNVIDRWYRGYVVDYVKWYIKDSPIRLFDPWPIFNLADSMISVGIFFLIVSMFFPKNQENSNFYSETK